MAERCVDGRTRAAPHTRSIMNDKRESRACLRFPQTHFFCHP